MDLTFTEEQNLLRDSLSAYLADHYDFETRRAAVRTGAGWRPEVWSALAHDLGILGATLPEAVGGLGGGPTETLVIMEEFGKALVVEPFLSTVVIGGGFLRAAGHPAGPDLMRGIAAGEVVIAFAYAEPQARYTWRDIKTTARKTGSGYTLSGDKAVVIGAPWATHLIVTARTSGAQRDAAGISLFLVEKSAPGVVTRDYPTVDGQRASEIHFENVVLATDALLGPEGEALPLIEAVIDEATVAVCAEAVGVLRRLLADTVAYTKGRTQFGKPISSFQVLQHRMVDMFMQVEQAVSMAYMATIRLEDVDPRARAKAVSAAKAQIGRACRFVGQSAIQLHGGMGMTDELAVGHYFKRATMIESQFGDTDHHLARFEALSYGDAA